MSCMEAVSSYAGCEKAMKNFILGMNKFDLILICSHL